VWERGGFWGWGYANTLGGFLEALSGILGMLAADFELRQA